MSLEYTVFQLRIFGEFFPLFGEPKPSLLVRFVMSIRRCPAALLGLYPEPVSLRLGHKHLPLPVSQKNRCLDRAVVERCGTVSRASAGSRADDTSPSILVSDLVRNAYPRSSLMEHHFLPVT